MIAITETRRQKAIKLNDHNRERQMIVGTGDSTDDEMNEKVRKGQEVQDDGRDLQQTLSDMAATDLTDNTKTDRERAGAISTSEVSHRTKKL